MDAIKVGKPNELILHKNVVIKDSNGKVLIYMSETETKPQAKNDKFMVEDLDDETFKISLKETPSSKPSASLLELDQRIDLPVYQQYLELQCLPHR